jgi:hypothetical protein
VTVSTAWPLSIRLRKKSTRSRRRAADFLLEFLPATTDAKAAHYRICRRLCDALPPPTSADVADLQNQKPIGRLDETVYRMSKAAASAAAEHPTPRAAHSFPVTAMVASAQMQPITLGHPFSRQAAATNATKRLPGAKRRNRAAMLPSRIASAARKPPARIA